MAEILQNTTYARLFQMILASDGRTGATGKSPVVQLSKGGAPFVAADGVVTERSNGWYLIRLTQNDTNIAGDLGFRATAPDCDDTDFTDQVKSISQLQSLTIGSSSEFNMTRNQLVIDALIAVKAIEEDELPPPAKMQIGIRALNRIMREEDAIGKHLWAVSPTPSLLTLQQDVGIYSAADGLPSNISRLEKVVYRGEDNLDEPMTIIQQSQYAELTSKFERGNPKLIFLSRENALADRKIYIHPQVQNVSAQSVVTGSDGNTYQCIRTHVAATENKPITGTNYRLFWQLGGSSPTTWAVSTSYAAPKQLVIWYKRPLSDFTNANDNPDLPPSWTRQLLLRLTSDLGDFYTLPQDQLTRISRKIATADDSTFKYGEQPTTENVLNRYEFF